MDSDLLRGILLGALGGLFVLWAFWRVVRTKQRLHRRELEHEKRLAESESRRVELEEQLETALERLEIARSLHGDLRERVSTGATVPPPEPWRNGLYRVTRPLVIGGRRLEQGVMVFTSEHHVLDSVTIDRARGSGSTAGNAINRDVVVDRDLQRALRQGALERVADAEAVERLGGSMQQVFRGFDQSMARMMESMGGSMDRVFRDFDRNLRRLGSEVGRVDRVDARSHSLMQMNIGRSEPTPGNPEAIVAELRKVNAKKPEPPPEPKRPSRYDVLVDDDEVV
jgi:hypothetical protein